MRILAVCALTIGFAFAGAHGVFAADSMKPSMGGEMKMAKCSANDPAVIVNTTKMTYELDTKANRSAMKGMMGHDKFICKSQADKMGAKMKSGAMKMKKM
ncbi:MAG: hypothetical protein ACREM8_06455 [Vulcanimicrobiaceae bacterium]